MSDIPDPMTPADCDLRDFPFMPLEVQRLRRSKAWLVAKRDPAIAFYMINLWAASWHEVPAASIEDDDDVLCDLAACDPKVWPKVREKALRGWVKCSDGRLYHPVVAEKALDSWARKRAQREKTEAARQALAKRRAATSTGPSHTSPASVTDTNTDTETESVTEAAAEIVTASKRQGQGQREGEEDPSPPSVARPPRGCRLPADWRPSSEDDGFAANLGLSTATVADHFADYWRARPGQGGVKLDWSATWRNWCRKEAERNPGRRSDPQPSKLGWMLRQ